MGIKRPPVYRVAVKQLLVLMLVGVVLGVIDTRLAWSVVSGGLIAIIPHFYFTVSAFRFQGAAAAAQVTRSFNRGEAGKFVLTLLGFACVFGFLPQLQAGAVFAGFIGMWLLQVWLTAQALQA
ncbi:hypothetical protein G8764_16110 [Pseudomaricurvus alcaniphilus]|uniref:ATP synthase subunit I n=1 Tax=Pseudomaricurvus alcaniphilus TaxID=1166482 RepID=UPI00140A71F9|nr:hypothetical protein [Pseudomaricurvus alcaniphilus]